MSTRLPEGADDAGGATSPPGRDPAEYTKRGNLKSTVYEDEMERLLDLGVDGIMTDRPTVLKSVLESRGEWRS